MRTAINNSAQIFNDAVNNFFSFNPANPYWILLAMYLRKNNELAVVENYDGESINIIAPQADKSYWEISTSQPWPKERINITIVGTLSGNDRLLEINKAFEKASESNFEEMFKPMTSMSAIYQWEPMFLLSLAEKLLSLDLEWFESNFNLLFDKVVRRIFAKERFDLYSQPAELTELIGKICHIIGTKAKTVYNPFAGVGSYSLIPGNYRFIGEEINPLIAAIANLRIISAGVKGEVNVIDSLNLTHYDADIIVSTPPFMLPVNDPFIERAFDGRNDAATLLLRKCAKNNICGIIVVPIGISFRNDFTKRVREMLIEHDCVDMVIELPANIFESVGIATAIYVINPYHEHKGKIRIINASECKVAGIIKPRIDVEEVIGLIKDENNYAVYVDCKTLADNDYSFSYSRYAQPEVDIPEGYKVVSMNELGEVFVERAPRDVLEGKFATFSQLANPNKLKIYTPSDFELKDLPPSSIKIEKDCLIISGARGLRASCVQTDGETLYAPGGYFCFLPNQDIILPQYLVFQIRSDFAQKQVGDRSLSSFRRDEFNHLKVLIPSLDEQKKVIDNYQASLISDLGVQVDNLKTQHFNEYERNMHLRKHALKQIMNEILPASRRIANFISSQDSEFSKDTIIAERSHSTLESYAVKLFRNVEKVNALITALTDDTQYGDPQYIEVDKFIANYQHSKLVDNYDLKFFGHNDFIQDVAPEISDETLVAIHEDSGKVLILPKPITVYIDPASLTTVFDNIIANAVKHGFTNSSRKDYAIRIDFRNVDVNGKEMVEFVVANNGEKLPSGMTADRMFRWGVGSGTGLGSWQTKNIIEHFGGTIEFTQFDDKPDGFNVEYLFTLPTSE